MKRLLIDSQVLLWSGINDSRLTRKAIKTLESEDSELFVSIASLWEIAIKLNIGKLKLPISLEELIHGRLLKLKLQIVPIKTRHLLEYTSLPLHHRDPFDRILIAQASIEQFSIVTSDDNFDQYSVSRIW